MNISILVGANRATVRLKVNGKANGVDITKVKFLYRTETASEYTETDEYELKTNGDIYGYGPFFYDLNGLEPETKYYIKMAVTNADNQETEEKSFTTCGLGVFEFNETGYLDTDGTNQKNFFACLENFKERMIGIGYNYITFGERILETYKNKLNEEGGLSAKVYCDSYKVGEAGAVTVGRYLGNIYVKPYIDLDRLLHEYRHFCGLSYDGYHGAIVKGPEFASFPEYSSNISKVVSFCRGGDGENFEIYMYNGENSIDSNIIRRVGGKLLGFFLLKALSLNDIDIIY